MPKLPWVSREQHEYVLAQLDKSEREREQLLARLLDGSMPERLEITGTPVNQTIRVDVDDDPREQVSETQPPAAFSTPFDRLEKRFEAAFLGGRIPTKFKARSN